jgi:hypothetical protein
VVNVKDFHHALASNNVDAAINAMNEVAVSGEVAGANISDDNSFFDDRNVFSQRFIE